MTETVEPRARCGRYGWRTVALVLALAGLGGVGQTSAGASAAGESGDPPPGGAVVRRTEHGIPHIVARDYRGLGLGAGFAFAEDNLCAFADNVLTLSGQRSRWFGSDDGNLASDIYHTWVNQSRTVERLLAGPPPIGPSSQARELVRGYAAGYNRYLAERTVAGLPDAACRGAGWVRPITDLDVWRRAYQIAELNGGEAASYAIANAAPPGTAVDRAVRPAAGASLWPRSAAGAPSSPRTTAGLASNAIGVGRAASAGRTGLLLANPHLPWNGDLRLYQQHLTIPGELDVSGAGFYGLPVVNMGHNDRLAWSHTASTAQTTTMARLTLVPGDPTSYLVDGQPRRMEQTTVRVAVRQADGQLGHVGHRIYRTPDGPIVAGGSVPWSEEHAYAMRDANAGNLRVLDQTLDIGRSRDVTRLHRSLTRHLGIPWANTIAADADGAAYFSGVQVVPHVSDELIGRCGSRTEYGEIVLDGSRSSCGWGSDADALAPGLFGPGRLPTLIRTDTVSNMNDSPWLTNPAAPITGYPSIVGDVGTERIARTRLGLDMIADRLDGSDGLGPPGFTLASLQATMLGNRNLVAEEGRAAVVAMCRTNPILPDPDGDPVDVRGACATLAAWDGRGDLDSRGAYLWQKFVQRATFRGADLYAVPFDPADPARTPRGVAADRPEVRSVFAETVRLFGLAGVPVDVAMGSQQHYAGVPLHGCADGCFNVITDEWEPTAGESLPDVAHGSTFIMAVELTAAGPRTRTLLTYGQSGNVGSPYRTDQARRYAAKRWVTERFTPAEIASDPALTVRTLRR
ncbi:penicillin acylase family protein [Micromonospora sp. NPDC049523]|uniref:penicillin acylase family protein n=1 Tax=Micromonospora sp. NPDC049523 TaxID=3155921 RepID=UPI0034460138